MSADTTTGMPSLVSSLAGNPLATLTSRLDFARLLDQRHRLMQVQTALPTLSLIPERMVFRESVGQPFELQLQCLSTSAHLELKTLIGEQISLKLLQSDGVYVPWHGYVFEAAQLGADGGLARYALTMRPWLSALALRRNSRVFHDQTALQVIEAVFADHHPQAHWRLEVTETLRVRSLCTQYRETDLAFVQRLLAAEGLSYHFEHLDGQAASDADAAAHARHVLVITDRLAQRPALGSVRFTSQHATANLAGQRDSVTAFMAQRELAPNAVTLAAWDYKRLVGISAQEGTALPVGELPALEVYDGSGAYRYENPEHAERAAALALARWSWVSNASKARAARGISRRGTSSSWWTTRCTAPTTRRSTTAVPCSPRTSAARKASTTPSPCWRWNTTAPTTWAPMWPLCWATARLSRAPTRTTFIAHRPGPLWCLATSPSPPPLVCRAPPSSGSLTSRSRPSATTASRSALPGQDASLGRQRERTRAISLQNAPGTWVRVAAPWAGANWGASLVPRIGSEVAVEFMSRATSTARWWWARCTTAPMPRPLPAGCGFRA